MIKIKTENGSIGLGSQYVALKGEKGDKGDPGSSGVYIGTEAPQDESINVWINTGAELPDTLVTAAEVIELIDAALGEISNAEEEEF